tara:strand:+ start:1030 stop:2172 length:1143 start_codon:yes stop_codon:yes gene_type:complete
MAYNILGITTGHNGSSSLVSDGKLILFLEEDRLSKIKHEANPLKTMFYILERYKIDELVITGTNNQYLPSIPPPPVNADIYTSLVRKYNPKVKTTELCHQHHLTHASNTFYNSGFKESAVLVIDCVGSHINTQIDGKEVSLEEAETIYKASYPHNFQEIHKSYFCTSTNRYQTNETIIDDAVNITRAYEIITTFLGWNALEAGKTMGLSSYGNSKNTLPSLIKNGRGNRDIFVPQPGFGGMLDLGNNPFLGKPKYDKKWHRDPSKITDLEKDLAYNIQKETQEEVAKLIEKTIQLTNSTNICIAGGYGLNCVANYYLKKQFPKINFYHEPLAHDSGNSLGGALLSWYEHSQDTVIKPRKTLYNGPQYSKEELLESVKKYI